MTDDFRGEMTLVAGDDSAKMPSIPIKVLDALHRSLIGPQETLKMRRTAPTVARPNDIAQLVNLLSQWMIPFHPISHVLRVHCTVKPTDDIRGDKKLGFSSLESFLEKYPAVTDVTKSIDIFFDCVLNANEGGPLDRLEMSITLKAKSSGDFLIRQTDDEERDFLFSENDHNMILSMKYSNYLIAKNLVTIIDDWFKALSVSEVEENFFDNFRKMARFTFNDFSLVRVYSRVFPIAVAASICFALAQNPSYSEIFSRLSGFYWYLTACVAYMFTYILNASLLNALGRIQMPQMRHLSLTSGDEKAIIRIQAKALKRRKAANYIFFGLGLTFLLSIVASIVANKLS